MIADAQASRVAALRQELTAAEAEHLKARREELAARYEGLSREDMVLLRNMLSERIRETYDGDNE